MTPTTTHPAHSADTRAARRRAVGSTALIALVLLASNVRGLAGSGLSQPAHQQAILLRLDPNRATPSELALLPGIGPKRAAAIVAWRELASERPAFREAADLDRIPGIGPITVARLRPYLCCPAERSPTP
ncbi:MAG: helix-hairpin-helix domain-containing protein [Phycisphaerae bacterium]|nr:helix-hairpin-helix domain-containing protein [Phycisphaerae bacterium]